MPEIELNDARQFNAAADWVEGEFSSILAPPGGHVLLTHIHILPEYSFSATRLRKS
jgi:hypothetical protein